MPLNGRSITRPDLVGLVCLSLFFISAVVQDNRPAGENASLPPQARTPLSEIPPRPAAPPPPARSLDEAPAVRALYDQAVAAMQDGAHGQAIQRLDEALNAGEGDFYEVLYLMARAKQRVGRMGEARLAAEQAAALRPGAADVHYLLGRLYRQQGLLDRATEHLRTATLAAERELNNANVTASWYYLGDTLAERGYLRAAAECFARFDRAIWDTHPEHRNNEDVAAVLAQRPNGASDRAIELLERIGDEARLLEVAAWAAKSRPQDAFLARLYARKLIDAGQPAAAFAFCRERLEQPNAPPALLRLAIEAARASDGLDEWIDRFEETAPGRQGLDAADLAARLGEAGDHARAVRLWRVLAQARPEDADVAWGLAGSLRGAGELRGAIEALIAFVRANPDTAEVAPQRLSDWMRPYQAADELLDLVTEYSKRPDRDFAADLVLGVAAAAAGETTLAEKLLQSALDARDGFALAHVAWGNLLLAQYRWQEAAQQAQEALRNAPRLAAAHYVRARALSGLDEHDQADKAYHAALDARPDEVEYALALARHYRRMGDGLAQQRYFQQALSIDPNNGEAAEKLIESYLAAGKTDIARTQLATAEASDMPEDVLRRIRTTVRYAAAGSPEDFVEELRRLFALHPDDVVTGMQLVRGEVQQNRIEAAYEVLNQVRGQAPDDEEVLALVANVQIARLEYTDAIAALETLAGRYPNRRPVLTRLAEACAFDFQVDRSRAVLERLLSLARDDNDRRAYRLGLLSAYLPFQDYDAALERIDGWMREEAGGVVAEELELLRLGVLREAGRFSEVAALATRRLEAGPGDPVRRQDFLDACDSAHQYKAAERRLRDWLREAPSDTPLAVRLAETLLADGRPGDALDVVNDFDAADVPGEHQIRRMRARIYAKQGRVDDAVEELEDLLSELDAFIAELDPNARVRVARELSELRLGAWGQIARVLLDAERFERATEFAERWVADTPESDALATFTVLNLRRGIAQAAGDDETYAAASERLLKILPNDPGLNNDLGYTWIDRGVQLDRAMKMIRLAVANEPLNAAFLDSLGWAHYKRGEFSLARKHLARATRLGAGQDAVIYDHLGDADFRLNDATGARRSWQKALSLGESSENASSPTQAELIASIRAKLEALTNGTAPRVPPTAQEP